MRNHPIIPTTVPPAHRRTAGAFTLIELMVAVSILTIMMMSFGLILSQSQRVVTVAERKTQTNSAGAAIAQMIRRDLTCLNKQGGMAIWQGADANVCFISMTSTGVYQSLTDPCAGTSALIDYGVVPDGHGHGQSMYRRVTILDPSRSTSTNDDHVKWDATYYAQTPANLITNICTDLPVLHIFNPPQLTDFSGGYSNAGYGQELRYFLSSCPRMEVAWSTPVTVSSTVKPQYLWEIGFGTSPWTKPALNSQNWWTTPYQVGWPRLVRIRYWLGDYDDAQMFEVITLLPR